MTARLVKRRLSPGGIIVCPSGHLISRRRFNAALRFRQRPSCGECGSEELGVKGEYEVRGGMGKGGTEARLVWKKKGTKKRRGNTAQRGTRRGGKVQP